MTDKRKINIPFYPYVFLLISVILLLSSLISYINYPSEMTVFYSLLGVGLLMSVIAFACRPSLFKDLFFSKKTALWINDIIFILMIIGIGVLLSHIAFRRNFRYDFTKNNYIHKLFNSEEKERNNLVKKINYSTLKIRADEDFNTVNINPNLIKAIPPMLR